MRRTAQAAPAKARSSMCTCVDSSCAPHLYSQVVAADDLENGLARITALAHELDERRNLFGRRELKVFDIAFLGRKGSGMCREVVQQLLHVEDVVERQPDVIRSHELHRVIDVPE